ncbi:epoxide hydrolase [Favolaschia claudopus]|uniref:Epoxide hydrolase n=1 Tax=Favolaschia claudopus TaxID=2862362 RepID=A0AAW0BPP4_9AGAR
MDEKNYKQVKTKRGLNYSYYFSAPSSSDKPTLFFSHGFPSASFLWRKQVPFFEQLGYGIIVPDHLGYGGTDKPTDTKFYGGRGLAEDQVDILDAENVKQVIAIAHDWGSYAVSCILHYFPQRVSAVAFLAVGYRPADGAVNPITQPEFFRNTLGVDLLAYQRFFVEPDAAAIIEKNIDSFINLLYPETPEVWKSHLSVDGATRAWIASNRITPLPSYVSEEDKDRLRKSLLSGGLGGPLCWYKQQIDESNLAEADKLPASARDIHHPVLYIAFTKDFVALPIVMDKTHEKYIKGPLTRKEVAGDHWALMSHPKEVNEISKEWLEGL